MGICNYWGKKYHLRIGWLQCEKNIQMIKIVNVLRIIILKQLENYVETNPIV